MTLFTSCRCPAITYAPIRGSPASTAMAGALRMIDFFPADMAGENEGWSGRGRGIAGPFDFAGAYGGGERVGVIAQRRPSTGARDGGIACLRVSVQPMRSADYRQADDDEKH